MTPSQSGPRGVPARIEAPTARQAVPPEDEADEVLFPPPRRMAPGPKSETPVPPELEPAIADAVEAVLADEVGGEARPGPMPTSAEDSEGVYRGVLWAARAAQECGRVLTVLTDRVEALEERLAALEAAERSWSPGPGVAPVWEVTADTEEVAALRQEVTTATEQLSRLAAEMSGAQQRGDERFTATESRLVEIGALSMDVRALEQRLNELGRAQVVFQEALTSHPGVRSAQRSVERLRGELAAVRNLVGEIDARLDGLRSLPAAVEQATARQVEELASEMRSLPADVQGLYRELDAIAERVTAREDSAGVAVEKARFVAEAVVAMREELEGIGEALARIHEAQAEARAWRDSIDRRLAALESPTAGVERLYQALARVVEETGGGEPTDQS
ncbi:MAG TPA: hypothetical protein VG455_05265 [Acidimicrobiales bacterium]|nr:hypothetical protein [Acidimicrobiales bacterium]